MTRKKPYAVLDQAPCGFCPLALFLAAVLVVIAAAALPYAYANATAAAQRRLPIYCTDRPGKVVSLTFDAAWGDEDTPQLIDILKKYEARATFFVVGEWVDRCGDSVKALFDAGHEIMNHSDSHPNMPKLSRERMLEEINRCNDKIQAITGCGPPFTARPTAITATPCLRRRTPWGCR